MVNALDLADSLDKARFRQELRTWLEKALPEPSWPEPDDLEAKAPFWRQWRAMLYDADYAGLTWPAECDGQGLDERMRVIFSEPDSGSDLASLRTKASKVDGGWRIQGQKIWTSRAQLAAHAILLARTGAGECHKGITYFLTPMGRAGHDGAAARSHAERGGAQRGLLDDVFLPDDAVVDGGWAEQREARGEDDGAHAAYITGQVLPVDGGTVI